MNSIDEGRVSIIIPVYNVKHLIDETINSVFSQSYKNWELILVDDLSTDGCYEYLKNEYSKYSQIIVIQNEFNSGAGYTRNKGLNIATGRYIAFLDSDDIWAEDKLKEQITFMQEMNAPISHTSYVFINELGENRKGYSKASECVDLVHNLKYTEIGTSTAVIDRKLVGSDFQFSRIRARQDLMLWLELLGRGHHSFGINKPLVKYRIRDGQVSGNKIEMLVKTLRL